MQLKKLYKLKPLTAAILLIACDSIAKPNSFKDERDGQVYKTVKIGDQIWMAENLNYKTLDSYCYEDDVTNCKKDGRLYTWEAAMNSCPDGFHLPSKYEWRKLNEYIEKYGFNSLPAGSRYSFGSYDVMGYSGYFWSSTDYSSPYAYLYLLHYYLEHLFRNYYNTKLLRSVRCLKGSN